MWSMSGRLYGVFLVSCFYLLMLGCRMTLNCQWSSKDSALYSHNQCVINLLTTGINMYLMVQGALLWKVSYYVVTSLIQECLQLNSYFEIQ